MLEHIPKADIRANQIREREHDSNLSIDAIRIKYELSEKMIVAIGMLENTEKIANWLGLQGAPQIVKDGVASKIIDYSREKKEILITTDDE